MDAGVHIAKVREMDETLPQVLRADAQENRDRVLAAARELFARDGLDVTMRQIARYAEVGPATLYRRFPTKHALLVEAFMDELGACRGIVRDAVDDPDPWRAFCTVIERLAVLNAQNQGFTDAFMSAQPGAIDFAAHRSQMLHELSGIARRAKDAGALRADFVVDDFVLVLLAGRGLATAKINGRTAAARRFAALAIDGFRATDSNSPLSAPAQGTGR
ncbi:UNVERIFIED_CONTAM: TetR family transcriptional regulator [Williamsia faeni]